MPGAELSARRPDAVLASADRFSDFASADRLSRLN
jgi:hypothetical protein